MTELRRRMIEDMQLAGLSSGTQAAYVRSVRALAKYHHRSPDQLTDEQIRDFFLYLIPVFDSWAEVHEVGLLFDKHLRSRKTIRRETVVPGVSF